MHETEIKVLEIDTKEIANKLENLKAEKIQDVLLVVDWYGPMGKKSDEQDWFLRIRSYGNGKIEVTWKGKHDAVGAARQVKEINIIIEDHEKMKMLFEAMGLICYAHQEKKRVSWRLGSTQFDLDTYPGMPSFLEIEAENEKEISKMIKELNLEKNETWNDGERTLIEGKYKLNWCDMRF